MLATLAVGAASAISGLFGGGADAEKFAERSSRVAAAYQDAKSGNVQAWWLLGAVGQVAPLPTSITWLGKSYDSGWTSREFGSAYDSIVDKAARYYRELAPKFQGAAVNTITSGLGGATIPVGQTITTAANAVNAIPGWAWLVGVAGLLYLLFRKGR